MRQAAWLLLAFGDERGYAGNPGYADEPKRLYRYDNLVPNHRQLRSGDLAVIRARRRLLGIARIEAISERPGLKERRSCPNCGTRQLTVRQTRTEAYHCRNGHNFGEPLVSHEPCTEFEASFGSTFIDTPDALSNAELKAACSSYNRQLAMQRLDLALVANQLLTAVPQTARLLVGGYEALGALPVHDEAAPEELGAGSYIPSGVDSREAALRAIRLRRGQQAFRQKLRDVYGDACMLSGCTVIEVVEAAHIMPFRSADDHHEANGLLLRSDLHTLFDLNLLGVDPDELRARFHPSVRSAVDYASLDGQRLRCTDEARPSRDALIPRWALYGERLARR